jgi:hypothetical protein
VVQLPPGPTVHISPPSHLQWRPVKALLMVGIAFVNILVRVLMVRVESFLKIYQRHLNISRKNICRL